MKTRKLSARILLTAAAISCTCFQLTSSCRSAQEFRAAAGDSLRLGLSSIAQGLIDGAFAVFEPDNLTTE